MLASTKSTFIKHTFKPIQLRYMPEIIKKGKPRSSIRMRPKFIFCTAVSIAILIVLILALVSPAAQKKLQNNQTKPWVALSLYIQQPYTGNLNRQPPTGSEGGAFIFHRRLTEGPENTSRVVGKAQGFIIPIEHFAYSAFNIIYLTFDTPEFSGSLSVQAKHIDHNAKEELTVVGGTGSFAFARGLAIFAQTDSQPTDVEAMYHVRLRLEFPNRLKTIPG